MLERRGVIYIYIKLLPGASLAEVNQQKRDDKVDRGRSTGASSSYVLHGQSTCGWQYWVHAMKEVFD